MSTTDTAQIIARAEQTAKDLLANSPACHDWDHTLRVRANALLINKYEKGNPLVVELAALLHDMARPDELADHGKTDHAEKAAVVAPQLLRLMGLDDEKIIWHVAQCIRTHRYRNRTPDATPQSLEARIIFDADKLDGIGAIGLARSFHFAGRIGARVHNAEQEALNSQSYSREDTAYREYLVKLRYVKDRMLTSTGHLLAIQRHQFMEQFFQQMKNEYC